MGLTAQERRRLRATVDPAALERFLAAAPEVPRVAVVAHFATEVELDDVLELQRVRYEAGEISAAELQEYERSMREPWPEDTSESLARSSKSGFRFVPGSYQYVLQVHPPSDPVLIALWDAIEPRTESPSK